MEHTRKLLALTAFALTLHRGAFAQKENAPRLLYMGQASIRITTEEGRVIYIDPYAGSEEQYEPTADLILVTHGHFDHNQIEKIKNRAEAFSAPNRMILDMGEEIFWKNRQIFWKCCL